MAHQEFGQRLLERVRNDTAETAVVEQFPKMEGRQLIMVLAPKKKDIPVKKKPEAKPEAAGAKKPEQNPAAGVAPA